MRAAQSLDGRWQVRLDSGDRGLTEEWWRPDTPFDRELPVPLAWQAADPELRTYSGVVWYRRTFELPESWQRGNVAVRFGAVDYAARVWLNGHELGGHEGGYTPFELELSTIDWPGPNHLVVRVLDPAHMDEIPHGKQGGRWYTRVSGPWQSVSLVARPRQRIARLRSVPDAHAGTFRVRVDCVGLVYSPHRLAVDVRDPEGAAVAEAVAAISSEAPSALLELRIAHPRLWSPESPVLYTLRARLVAESGVEIDSVEERVGLRDFEARDGCLFLNGQLFYMRGALDQAYWPESLYTAPSDAEIEREIRLAKSMGLNLLRKHIKPEDPRYLDACDRLGMLVWAEPASPIAYTPAARAALRRDLLEMIERDANRPSVVIWSLYNEDWGLPGLWSAADRHAWLRELYTEVRSLDSTRPICDNSGWAHVLTDLNDYHEYYSLPDRAASFLERLDFIAAQPADNYAQGQAPRGGEPVLISEWGNWALVDPRVARERNRGVDPPWFDYQREDTVAERMKTVAGFEHRFAELGLQEVFGTPSALVEHAQSRAFRSVKAQIEEMRRRPEIQGWVVTEFTDIEWEANGWLDYWRQPKTFTPHLAELNADLALIAAPERASVWGGERVVVPVWLSNFSARHIAGVLRWSVAGTRLGGEVPAAVDAFERLSSAIEISFHAPDDHPTNARLVVELIEAGEAVARAFAELAWAPRSAALVTDVGLNVQLSTRLTRQRLERQGYIVPRRFQPELGLMVTDTLSEDVLAFVRDGGRVVWLAEDPGAVPAELELRFARLPTGESWRMAGGAAWAKAERLGPAPVLASLGWEVAALFPTTIIDAACRQSDDEQLAGWFEGWLANAGLFALRRRVERGQLLITTFRLAEAYGLDPVATLLLNRMLEIVRGE